MTSVSSIINIYETLKKVGSSDLPEAKKFAIAHELKADLPAPQICPTSSNTLDIVTKEIEDFLDGKRKHFAEEEKKANQKKRQKNIRKKHQKIIIFSNLMKTEEGRELRRLWSTKKRKNAGRPKGVPDGYTKETIKPIREKAKKFAEVVVSKIDIKNEYAKEALETAVEILRTPSATRDRLASARLILEFTEANQHQNQR